MSNVVIPAKAGIHSYAPETLETWIPAFAGMTALGGGTVR